MAVVNEIHKEYLKLDTCGLFTGKESLDEVVALLFSPKGIEFCVESGFPSLNDFERADKEFLREKGIYVNEGSIEIKNKETVLVAGNTNAILKYNDTEKAYNVILMHGAKAQIIADNYAVVFVSGEKENLTITTSNNAIVK
ncbi:hypothetical protein [Polaribacter sp. IC073]|uniref:hypothetical protein n=1 Tax=Polaribacter sp. IC073 TaxID=2508540 RepID=UPI0011BF1259|nr:hypothetical protein [Polaribacter sp. IC073]TXD47332.1 hypothetical protein ES045_12095 [Polaribacter sp. IC073]